MFSPYPSDYVSTASSPPFLRFQELARAAGLSRAFTLSVKLQLYTVLRDQREKQGKPGLTAAEVAQLLQLNTQAGFRGVVDWLDVLVTVGTLQRTGVGQGACYSNSADADEYLSKQSEAYMGGHAILYHDRTFPQYNFLEHSLRTGSQPELARQLVVPVLQTFAGTGAGAGVDGAATGGDPGAFALGMTGCNKPAFELLASKFDFSRYRTLGDIGGSAGVLCCAVAKAHQHMTCTTLDLPAVHAAAEEYVARQGLQDRVKVADIDFFAEGPFPSGLDVITMGMILHDWGPQKKILLVQKAYDALPPGGAFISLDTIIDDGRCRNVWGLLMSLDMLMEFEEEGSADYTFEEFTSWAKAAGFKSTQLIRLVGPNSAAVAFK